MYISNEASVRAELLKRYYNNPLAEYFEVEKIFELINRKYFWKDIKADVKEYVNTYNVYQRVKVKRYRSYSELSVLPIPLDLWKEITMNFITDLPPSKRNKHVYDSILVIVNRSIKIAYYLLTTKKINIV